jgi:hypothetical protein
VSGGEAMRSVLEFFIRTRMSLEDFVIVADDLTSTNAAVIEGLVNVNTASAEVLACLPGMDLSKAESLVSHRRSNPNQLNSIAWVAEVLDQETAFSVGPYLTARSFQFTADIAALGHFGRGYRRMRYIIDMAEGAPKFVFRDDLTHLGWALGPDVRERVRLANRSR